jgi:rRNA maturation protein Rpf1
VRSFTRDLSSVLPGVERFNRGGMGLPELVARIGQNGAKAAIVISMWRGNPGELTILSPNGEEILNIRLESVLLRREVNPSGTTRIRRVEGVLIKSDCSVKVKALAKDIASLLNIGLSERENPHKALADDPQSFIWFEDGGSGKILWTHYDTLNGIEVGPRIRLLAVRRKSQE